MVQASSLATQFVVVAALFAVGGRWLDHRVGTDPWLTLLGAAVGLALGTWLIQRGMKRIE
jgi:F0F1-type ATP synthase assembly protein I